FRSRATGRERQPCCGRAWWFVSDRSAWRSSGWAGSLGPTTNQACAQGFTAKLRMMRPAISPPSVALVRPTGRSALFQEHVARGIGRAAEATRGIASAVELAALGIDPLHGRDR